jgi:hypothetical protein
LVKELHPEVVHSYGFYTNIAAWWVVSTALLSVPCEVTVDDKASSGSFRQVKRTVAE